MSAIYGVQTAMPNVKQSFLNKEESLEQTSQKCYNIPHLNPNHFMNSKIINKLLKKLFMNSKPP